MMKNLGNILILGDSYSTFTGYVPQGYAVYYTPGKPAYQKDVIDDNDVTCVEETWWYNFSRENGNLALNCSWSGSTICNTGWSGRNDSGNTFIGRLDKLIADGFFSENKIDTLLIFGGTNDSWSDAPIGERMYSGWTKEDLYSALPAFGYLLDTCVNRLSGVKVYCIINTELKEELSSEYIKACKKYSVDYIELCDIEKFSGHPTVRGMKQIRTQIEEYISNN